jgi:hypothetical protein
MNENFSAAQIHIDELDREIETIRTERLLRATSPTEPSKAQRAKAGVGRGLISLGVALVGDGHGRQTRTNVRV